MSFYNITATERSNEPLPYYSTHEQVDVQSHETNEFELEITNMINIYSAERKL